MSCAQRLIISSRATDGAGARAAAAAFSNADGARLRLDRIYISYSHFVGREIY
jgi:hypothetical protein